MDEKDDDAFQRGFKAGRRDAWWTLTFFGLFFGVPVIGYATDLPILVVGGFVGAGIFWLATNNR